MSLLFEPITCAQRDAYQNRLAQTPQISADYSFSNLWAWCGEYDLSWAWEDDLVWIRQGGESPAYWAPVGNWKSVPNWPDRLSVLPERYDIIRVPEQLAGLLVNSGAQVTAVEDRDQWEYLYHVHELVKLKGNRFHGKKNLLRQFRSAYEWNYRPLDEGLIKRALLMQYDWCAWRNCEASAGLAAENRVITKVLKSFDDLHLLGGAIMIKQMVVAFTVAERLDGDTLVIHFEKALNGYKGVYQAINHEFLAVQDGFEVVNREQDLGNEGLRKAKMSYNPFDFLKKFRLLRN